MNKKVDLKRTVQTLSILMLMAVFLTSCLARKGEKVSKSDGVEVVDSSASTSGTRGYRKDGPK